MRTTSSAPPCFIFPNRIRVNKCAHTIATHYFGDDPNTARLTQVALASCPRSPLVMRAGPYPNSHPSIVHHNIHHPCSSMVSTCGVHRGCCPAVRAAQRGCPCRFGRLRGLHGAPPRMLRHRPRGDVRHVLGGFRSVRYGLTAQLFLNEPLSTRAAHSIIAVVFN